MAVDPGTGGTDTSTAGATGNSTGDPVIEMVRAYKAVSPFGLLAEFRYLGFDNWTEKVEGDTTVDVIVDRATGIRLTNLFTDGAFSMIISLISSSVIRRIFDAGAGVSKLNVNNYIYDSYYVQAILPIAGSKNYRLVCVGAKEYLGHRLAIPAARNTIDGTVSVPDGSQEAKPIPSNQYLAYTNKTYKGIIAALLAETALLQAMPIGNTTFDITGTRQRTYLMKDFRSIKEAIDNMIDDVDGIDVTFDGGLGSRNFVQFMFSPTNALQRGNPTVMINDRTTEIISSGVEKVSNEAVNNLWAVGNAADGNILLSHKVAAGSTSKILLQTADTSRNDIQTPQFLLDYTLGTLARSGQQVRTASFITGLTQKFFLSYCGNYFYMLTPDHMDLDLNETFWYITGRTIDTESKTIHFDCIEYIMDNNGNGIPDRLE